MYEALKEVSAWVGENVNEALEPSEIEGVDGFAESAMVVKLSTKVKPGTHIVAARHIRKHLQEVFDRRGIQMAYPRRVLYLHNEGSRDFLHGLGDALQGKEPGPKKDAAS